MNTQIKPRNKGFNSLFSVPGDKSISHRSIMFSALANGKTKITGLLTGEDCMSTISCFKKLGIKIEFSKNEVIVHGKGLNGLTAPTEVLNCNNSGTTMRLMAGILAGQNFDSVLTGDASIQKRPMDRVMNPLREMGANISGVDGGKFAPLTIKGTTLKNINYTLPVASAQVKSCVILASLYAKNGTTTIVENEATRDHTEIMLNYLGANIKKDKNVITCTPLNELISREIVVPGDISSAAFLIVAGIIVPNSSIIISNVGVNLTRTGIISVLKEMGADINVINRRNLCGEFVADIQVKSSKLTATTIGGSIIPRLIDEIPVLAVAAVFATGDTIIKDAQELKVKESNRIKTMVTELTKMGAEIEETEDGMIIHGSGSLKGAVVETHMDHRIAMSLSIAGLMADSVTTINNSEIVDISFPGFFEYLVQ